MTKTYQKYFSSTTKWPEHQRRIKELVDSLDRDGVHVMVYDKYGALDIEDQSTPRLDFDFADKLEDIAAETCDALHFTRLNK